MTDIATELMSLRDLVREHGRSAVCEITEDATRTFRAQQRGIKYGCEFAVAEINKLLNQDWQEASKQSAAVGFLQGVLQGLRIGLNDEDDHAKIIDSALRDKRYFPAEQPVNPYQTEGETS